MRDANRRRTLLESAVTFVQLNSQEVTILRLKFTIDRGTPGEKIHALMFLSIIGFFLNFFFGLSPKDGILNNHYSKDDLADL